MLTRATVRIWAASKSCTCSVVLIQHCVSVLNKVIYTVPGGGKDTDVGEGGGGLMGKEGGTRT